MKVISLNTLKLQVTQCGCEVRKLFTILASRVQVYLQQECRLKRKITVPNLVAIQLTGAC
jgi:hypothetical protein